MNQKINDINSQKDTNISILYHIKNNLAVDVEIRNILAGKDIDITIKKYFQNSPDFQKLLKRIEDQKIEVTQLEKEINKERCIFEREKLEALEKGVLDFKIGALRLAETFLSISTKSERLKKAKAYFEKGLISEADKILVETELSSDQDALIAKMEYLQVRKVDLLESLISKDKN